MRTTSAILTDCPLATLPVAQAAAFVARLHAPGGRFARAFHFYWREVVALDEAEARARTSEELESAANAVLSRLGDPGYRVVTAADEPIALYGFRPLESHPWGRRLARVIEARALHRRYPAPLAIAHAVGILDAHASLLVLRTILLSIARAALDGAYRRVLFFTSDHRLRGIYRRFGMEFPADLAFPDSRHLVGVYEPGDPANLERMRAAARELAS